MMITENMDWRTIKFESESGKVLFTYADIEKLPEWPEGPLLEIIDGVLFMVPSPNLLHQEICLNLATILRNLIQDHHLGRIFTAPIDVIFTEKCVAIPDIVYVSKSRENILNPKNIAGVPDLVIEVLSENKNRDLVTKKKLYEHFGVPDYWIIDPVTQKVLLYSFDPKTKKFHSPVTRTGQETITAKGLPGIKIPVTHIFKIESMSR
ncbi:MAG: hypothetical protein RBG13Loki_0352 [Promethearchaeota archaeon CR_4]|nr:MAG: hypothetical protein RBG13Loki_0352 [Candidatus Lokiarchaeota archaeon CR_4]